jgi:hypothetical protein
VLSFNAYHVCLIVHNADNSTPLVAELGHPPLTLS